MAMATVTVVILCPLVGDRRPGVPGRVGITVTAVAAVD